MFRFRANKQCFKMEIMYSKVEKRPIIKAQANKYWNFHKLSHLFICNNLNFVSSSFNSFLGSNDLDSVQFFVSPWNSNFGCRLVFQLLQFLAVFSEDETMVFSGDFHSVAGLQVPNENHTENLTLLPCLETIGLCIPQWNFLHNITFLSVNNKFINEGKVK